MFERWRTFELTPDGYRETVNGIGDTLRKLGVSDKEAEAGKQLVEHIYSLQLSRRLEVCDKVKVRKRFGDVSLRLETKGDEYNPLQMLEEWNEDDPDYERTVFLKSKKEQLSYAHKNGLNIVTVRVHEAGNKQIRYTLFAMVLGIDPLTSMFRTTINTIGDIAVTTALSKNEGMMDEAVYMGTAENG